MPVFPITFRCFDPELTAQTPRAHFNAWVLDEIFSFEGFGVCGSHLMEVNIEVKKMLTPTTMGSRIRRAARLGTKTYEKYSISILNYFFAHG
jgi:hypothetical protein